MTDYSPRLAFRDRDLRAEGLFVAEGRLLTERTIASGAEVLGVWAARSAADDASALVAGAFSANPSRPVPLEIRSDGELSALAGFPFHRGILALARRPKMLRASDTAAATHSRILILPAITDPGNLGTLLRSALAFGFDTVWLGRESCDPFNRKALRASMGAALSLDLREAEPARLELLTGAGVPVYAAALEDGAFAAGRETTRGGCALVLGNEHDGIPDDWRRRCSRAVMVPVSDRVDSLNVAIAGSILMWVLGSGGADPL